METIVVAVQIVVALGILNVWLLRFGKPSSWRGGQATNLREEFEVYGLPPWFLGVVGFLKVSCAVALVAGIWIPVLVRPAAIGLAGLMLGAVAMHVKVKDPLQKSLPALCVLALCAFVAVQG